MHKLSITLLTVLAALAAATRVGAGSHKAERIIDKYVEASGGKKLRAVQTLRVTGQISVLGLEAPVKLQMKRPGRCRMDMKMMGKDVVQAYDGKTAWWINPFLGAESPTAMPDDFAQQLLRWTEFESPLIDYRRKRHRVRYIGEENTPSGPADVIEVKLRNGENMQIFIDQKTHLEVRRSFDQTFGDKTIRVDTNFSDYKSVDGIMTPRSIHGADLKGDPYAITIDTWEFGVDIDDAAFRMQGL